MSHVVYQDIPWTLIDTRDYYHCVLIYTLIGYIMLCTRLFSVGFSVVFVCLLQN